MCFIDESCHKDDEWKFNEFKGSFNISFDIELR